MAKDSQGNNIVPGSKVKFTGTVTDIRANGDGTSTVFVTPTNPEVIDDNGNDLMIQQSTFSFTSCFLTLGS